MRETNIPPLLHNTNVITDTAVLNTSYTTSDAIPEPAIQPTTPTHHLGRLWQMHCLVGHAACSGLDAPAAYAAICCSSAAAGLIAI